MNDKTPKLLSELELFSELNDSELKDVANLARFLAGPESRWITGQVIAVDGGHMLRRGPDFGELVVDSQ